MSTLAIRVGINMRFQHLPRGIQTGRFVNDTVPPVLRTYIDDHIFESLVYQFNDDSLVVSNYTVNVSRHAIVIDTMLTVTSSMAMENLIPELNTLITTICRHQTNFADFTATLDFHDNNQYLPRLPGLRSNSRIDRMYNRLKRFVISRGGKRSLRRKRSTRRR